MAYDPKNLSVLAFANGFTLWHYTTTARADDVNGAGYFSGACDMVRVGDMILVNTDTDARPSGVILLVSECARWLVSVANLTPVGASEAD